MHTIYAANGIVSHAFTGPSANEIIPNGYLTRLLKKRKKEVMLEYFFFAIVFDHPNCVVLWNRYTFSFVFFLPSNLLSFDLPLLSYIMDVSLVSKEKNTCRIKDTAER